MRDRLQLLEDLVATLRGPGGCPWDRQQTLRDVRAYLVEEVHEAASAIDREDLEELAEELGDVLFQTVFAASLASESGGSDLATMIESTHRKMVSRHPHVFGDQALPDSAAVREAWERRKAETSDSSALSGVPDSLPALLAAYRMSQKVAALGFDWPDANAIMEKVDEELDELRTELGNGSDEFDSAAVRQEVGDLLFTIASLARRLGFDPDAALASANRKFKGRFERMEQKLAARGQAVAEVSTEDLDRLWDAVKAEEKVGSDGSR